MNFALLLRMEQPLVYGVGELLQDRAEQPVVQRQVAVGVAEHKPASQRRVRAGQLALDSVLGLDQDGLATQLSVPGKGRCLRTDRSGHVSLCKINVKNSNKSLTLLF